MCLPVTDANSHDPGMHRPLVLAQACASQLGAPHATPHRSCTVASSAPTGTATAVTAANRNNSARTQNLSSRAALSVDTLLQYVVSVLRQNCIGERCAMQTHACLGPQVVAAGLRRIELGPGEGGGWGGG